MPARFEASDERRRPGAGFLLPAVPNVFETPWAPGDPPMPWAGSARGSRTRRRSRLPWVVFAMMLGIGMGLWRDKPARARVVSQLLATRQQATAFIHR